MIQELTQSLTMLFKAPAPAARPLQKGLLATAPITTKDAAPAMPAAPVWENASRFADEFAEVAAPWPRDSSLTALRLMFC
jgi:hypothetical protein